MVKVVYSGAGLAAIGFTCDQGGWLVVGWLGLSL